MPPSRNNVLSLIDALCCACLAYSSIPQTQAVLPPHFGGARIQGEEAGVGGSAPQQRERHP